jgi:plasmid stabilization system protein ParE
MSLDVEIHPSAAHEARKAYRWYLARSPRASERFIAALDYAVAKIAEFPDRYARNADGTQSYQLRKFPYYIVYRHRDTIITILAVAHSKRKRGYWKRRAGGI